MKPSFSIYEPNSTNKVASLKACFIKEMEFKRNDLPSQICADDGLVYETIYEDRIPQTMFFQGIVSFQQHTHGRYAVIRVKKDRK